ncbi:hypothetical protein E1267_21625 [Nonomuraea longispora]|uniref:DUF5753 domain-containing protein n=1 Tax=Nonomuraea longispora TaxID=1848320 RepID=A0A4R4N9M4_9ACTN|nr:DUF5753 domain-containing protein [Nonomuraea longispora]TDC04834.1 hypothetical protein E1267_21625 [Nonomuraea longispora]
MEDAPEPVSSAYVQVGDSFRICDRVRDGTQRGGLDQGLMGSVLVVEPFVLAQGVTQVAFVPEQAAVQDNRPTLWAILDEGVLTRPTGSEAVMVEQMAYLATLDEHPHVNIRVLPRNSWLTTGLQGAFILASGPEMPDTAYLESITLSQITADTGRVREVKSKYEMLHNEALPRRVSLQMIEEMVEKWTK